MTKTNFSVEDEDVNEVDVTVHSHILISSHNVNRVCANNHLSITRITIDNIEHCRALRANGRRKEIRREVVILHQVWFVQIRRNLVVCDESQHSE